MVANDYGEAIVATPDGGFALAGRTDNPLPGASQAWVMKADAVGAVQWSIRFDSDYGRFSAITALRDGGFVVAGEYRRSPDYEVWVVRLTATGAVVWQRRYGGALDDFGVGTVLERSDGDLLLTANTQTFSPNPGSKAAWLIALTSNGAVRWQHRYWAEGGVSNYWPEPKLSLLANGDLLLASLVGYSTINRSWTIRLTATGDPIWQLARDGPSAAFPSDVAGMPDGGAVVIESALQDEDGIRRIDGSGSVVSCSAISPALGFSHAPTFAPSVATTIAVSAYAVSQEATSFDVTAVAHVDDVRCPCVHPASDAAQFISVSKTGTSPAWKRRWQWGPAGLLFDLVRGQISSLRATAGDFTAAVNAVPAAEEVCWENSDPFTELEEMYLPPPGEGFFLLLRTAQTCVGTYDEGVPDQIGARDVEIGAAPRACP